jgi:hypothetical protein
MAAGSLFLRNINGNERICPYLKNDPFKPENIQIRIFLQKPDGSESELDKLTVIVMLDGKLKYRVDNPETGRFKTIYEETYAAATKSKTSSNLKFA